VASAGGCQAPERSGAGRRGSEHGAVGRAELHKVLDSGSQSKSQIEPRKTWENKSSELRGAHPCWIWGTSRQKEDKESG